MKLMQIALRSLDRKSEFWLCFSFYTFMAAIVFIEVLRRYFFGAASSWGEETAIYAFIWMTYIAAARGVRGRRHLAVTFIRDRLSRRKKFYCLLLSDSCFFSLAIIITYYSIGPVWTNIKYGQKMLGAELPMAIASISIPVGWAFIAFRVVQRSFLTIKRFRAGQPLMELETEIKE